MKRAALAVALLSLLATGSPALATQGKVAVVYPSNLAQTDAIYGNLRVQAGRNNRIVLDVFDRLGIDYFTIPGKHARVEQLRRGIISRGGRTDGLGEIDTVVAVVHLGFHGNISANGQTGYRGDSLFRIVTNSDSSGVDVPHLFLSDNSTPLTTTNTTAWLSDAQGVAAARCSTGVTGAQTAPSDGQSFFWYSDKTVRLQPAAYVAGWVNNGGAAAYPGGVRPILGMSASAHSIKRFDAAETNRNAAWPDSMPFIEDSDTLSVWELPWNFSSDWGVLDRTVATAKPMVLCQWGGIGTAEDSLSGQADGGALPIGEGNLQPLLVAIARFDSICGGITRKSADAAITVQGALSRGLRRWNRGIAPSDTAVFYGSLDSLKAWGVPVTFFGNVNADSATAYARDIIKLKEVWNAKFAVQVWDGVADSTVGGIRKSNEYFNGNPRDLFGKYTRRAVYGDGSGAGADTSFWTLAKVAAALRDSIWGPGRASTAIRAALDDWDFISNNAAVHDSVLWALPEAGFNALIVDGRQSRRGSPGGSFKRQQVYRSRISGAKPIKILAHSGGMLSGGNWQQVVWDSSSIIAPYVAMDLTEQEIDRSFAAIFLAHKHYNFDLWKYDDAANAGWRGYLDVRNENEDFFPATFPQRGYAINLSCASLSGNPTNPARSGLWVIKALWQTSELTRRMSWGGRSLLRLTYPEAVRL